MAKAKYSRTKPLVKIATIGHDDHGKSTLTEAITKVMHDKSPDLNPFAPFEDLAGTPEERKAGQARVLVNVDYQTSQYHYGHTDCSAKADHIKNMISGGSRLDGVILVVSAADGPMPKTREHVVLARQTGVPVVAVALNKADAVDDSDILDQVENDVRDLLTECEYDGENVPVVPVSARQVLEGDPFWGGELLKLIDAIDEHIPHPEADSDEGPSWTAEYENR